MRAVNERPATSSGAAAPDDEERPGERAHRVVVRHSPIGSRVSAT